jgi:hypothetical protein
VYHVVAAQLAAALGSGPHGQAQAPAYGAYILGAVYAGVRAYVIDKLDGAAGHGLQFAFIDVLGEGRKRDTEREQGKDDSFSHVVFLP